MPHSHKRSSHRHHHSSWRDYQTALQGRRNRRRRIRVWPIVIGILALCAVIGLIALLRGGDEPSRSTELQRTATPSPAPVAEMLGKAELRRLLSPQAFNGLAEKHLTLPTAAGVLQVETSLNPGLQSYLFQSIDREYARHVGIVVLDPVSGQVLTLAGFDRTDPAANPCLRSEFPAASLFKIVTAAAAVDQCGYDADSPVQYYGSKHTLYKRQLTNTTDRYTTTIPLREAFAESINPVFGKLGGLRLRKPLLEQAAAAFGFNQTLDFDLTLPPSRFQISDQPYNWAEIASGFNLETTISPLHGALLAAAVVNGGYLATPTLVERISDGQGETLYRRVSVEPRQIMSPRAAAALGQMMESTVASGTARKAFRRVQTDSVLSRLTIGGKTGSIDSRSHDVRYDWFVGFAKERQGSRQIAVAVLVAHEKFLSIRASDYARRAMSYYFAPSRPTDSVLLR